MFAFVYASQRLLLFAMPLISGLCDHRVSETTAVYAANQVFNKR